jgi:hypothetical protein
MSDDQSRMAFREGGGVRLARSPEFLTIGSIPRNGASHLSHRLRNPKMPPDKRLSIKL